MPVKQFQSLENVRKSGQISVSTTALPVTQIVASGAGTTFTTTTATDAAAWDLSGVDVGDIAVTSDGYRCIITEVNDGTDTITTGYWLDPNGRRGGLNSLIKPTDTSTISIQRISLSRSISIVSDSANSQIVYVGLIGTAINTDYPLQPGESLGLNDFNYVDITRVYVLAASGTQTVYWILGAPSGVGNYASSVAPATTWGGALSWGTFADGDTTPDIASGIAWATANTGATSITDFEGQTNKMIFVFFGDGDTTIVHDATKIFLQLGFNVTFTQNSMQMFIDRGGIWYQAPMMVP